MGKAKKTNRKKSSVRKLSVKAISSVRDGGQIALKGYSYQLLYSCYLILSSVSSQVIFQLEGIEDIDYIKQTSDEAEITHIQIKTSKNKQDASFLYDVFENFLEVYLTEANRHFKLIYDFHVAKGNLSRLFELDLDKKSRDYWRKMIEKIRENNQSWNWSLYDFDKFISSVNFEKVERVDLEEKIEQALIKGYDITTDNINLFLNSIKIFCFEKMEHREFVTKAELDNLIQIVKIEISKGPQNPAHSWIRKLDYSINSSTDAYGFYEGKKTSPADVVRGLPIRRKKLEKEIIKSFYENIVTVIKASSGQGKTTLALQVIYELQSEYTAYQMLWCNDIKEIGNIIQYFKTRIKLGEKVIILIDNLDSHLSKWNYLVQQLQYELSCHYKLIVTTREMDWYNYCGDLSAINSLNVVKPILEETDAIEIFDLFKNARQLHPNVISWKNAWDQIADRKLLIEYVYILTHGEMLSERIASQMIEIGQSVCGKVKCEILRKVCFADVCGVRISATNLYKSLSEKVEVDYGELIKSMESEFLISVDSNREYIQGLHPIRSKHVIDRLHEFFSVDETATSVISIMSKEEMPILFSRLTEFNLNVKIFFQNIVDLLWNKNDLSNYISAMQGLFSGCVTQYYCANKTTFDEANTRGGLLLLSTEMCPFAEFTEFGVVMDSLDRMQDILPDNENIKYLRRLKEVTPICDFTDSYIHVFCESLYKKLLIINFEEMSDIESFSSIIEWMYNIDSQFNLTSRFSLENVWRQFENLSLNCISALMNVFYLGNKNAYMEYVHDNMEFILTILKQKTKSHRIFINHDKNEIHIEYILRLEDVKDGSNQSVSRLKYICKSLPIFDFYCADAIKPRLYMLDSFNVPNDAHKEMPIRNIVIMFRQDLTSLWNKTIMSNYEFYTATEWINHWFEVRQLICVLADKFCVCIYKILEGKELGGLAKTVDQLRGKLFQITMGEKRYPNENHPFEKKSLGKEELVSIRNDYFQSMYNFINQFSGFLLKDERVQRLAEYNLAVAQGTVPTMQYYFAEIAVNLGCEALHDNICERETQVIEWLISCCNYYKNNLPTKYFDKYDIKRWYDNYCREERRVAELALSGIASEYSVKFPEKVYSCKALRHYPIIVHDYDMTSEERLMDLIVGCVPFANTSFDYLDILTTNNNKEINPYALRFSQKMLVDIEKIIEGNDYLKSENLAPPYPVEISEQMIGCFSEKYKIGGIRFEKNDDIPIGDIAEELWIYSKTVRLLTAPEDTSYLDSETRQIKKNIAKKIEDLEGKISFEDLVWIKSICEEVFRGRLFDDRELNNFIEKHIQNIIK